MGYKFNPFTGKLDVIAGTGAGNPIQTIFGTLPFATGPNGSGQINFDSPNITISGNPITNTITFVSNVTNLDQQNIIYVASSGNNTFTGLNIEKAVQTFTTGIARAVAKGPNANYRWVVWCFDDAIYTEDITVPSYVDIFAPNATLTGTITVADDVNVKFHAQNVADATIGTLKSVAGTTYSNVEIDIVKVALSGIGAVSLGGRLNYRWKEMYLVDGIGIGDITSALAEMHIYGNDIYISGTGIGIGRANGGTTQGHVDAIEKVGGGTGTAVFMLEGTMNVNINEINTTAAINIDGTAGACILNLNCNDIAGTQAATNGAILNIWSPIPSGAAAEVLTSQGPGLPPVWAAGGSGTSVNLARTLCWSAGGGTFPKTGAGTTIPVYFPNVLIDSTSNLSTTTNANDTWTADHAGFYGFILNYHAYSESLTFIANTTAVLYIIPTGGLGGGAFPYHAFSITPSGAWGAQPEAVISASICMPLAASQAVTFSLMIAGGGADDIRDGGYFTNLSVWEIPAKSGVGSVLPWSIITAASANMSSNHGYVADRGTLVTLTLPVTAGVGDLIEVAGKGAGGWLIAQNANQMIHINGATSTTGVGGSIASVDRYNSIKLLCTVANLEFDVLSSEGTLTLT
jgi:hypothetical protein